MGIEIERKFLVKADSWKQQVLELRPELIRQGYLCRDPERTVRVRQKGEKAYLTIKGKTAGMSRQEFEYEIPVAEAQALLLLCKGPLIEKQRYRLLLQGQLWEIDEFSGDNHGLLLAEAELEHEQQKLNLPDWIEKEVTGDIRYYNSNLGINPFCRW
jgi:adenylate cyclase